MEDTDERKGNGKTMVVRGNTHQGYPYFTDSYSGNQCTIIAVVALCFLFLRNPIDLNVWSSTDIDNIIQEGHIRYIKIILHMGISPRYLQHNRPGRGRCRRGR